jgi:DNA-binding transcriptional MerR regulator
MVKGTSVYVRGEPLPCHKLIKEMLDVGFDKEEIRKMCNLLKITNFSQTWEYVYQQHKKETEDHIRAHAAKIRRLNETSIELITEQGKG